jgi:phage-related protein
MALIDTTYRIRVPLTKKQSYRRRTLNFGDGYEQRSLDGINNLRESWDITFIGLDNTKKGNLLGILNTAAAVTPISWIAPGEIVAKQWIFNNVSLSVQSLNYFEITCTADLITGYAP